MDIETLEREFTLAKASTDYDQHQKFIKQLLSSDAPEIIAYHFSLLKRRENWDLYQDIRYAFRKRGAVAERFLVDKMKTESDPELQADALQILGGLRSKEVLPLARHFVSHQDPDLRYRACIVLGWVGTEDDIDILGNLLLNDSKGLIRGYAATALRQLWRRLPEAKPQILVNLKKALESEIDAEALPLIIVSLQSIMNKGFGLKENIDEGKITGNVQDARKKALKALELIKG